ncbi:hypothetical protein Tco_1219449 [Tanacetum coccineum]
MAFTASASVSTIYIQQFYNTLTYEAKTGAYSFELDETRFVLDVNLLREDLEITPIDQAYQFVSPMSGDAIMDFVNELGKTSGHDRPRYLVLQMLWGIITSQSRQYPIRRAGGKDKPHVILILSVHKVNHMSLGRILHKHSLRIKKNISVSSCMKKKKYPDLSESAFSTKQTKPKPAIEKSSKPAPAPKPKVTKEKPSKASTAKPPKPKPAKEKSTKATSLQKASKGKVTKVHTVKSSLWLVDEPDEEPTHLNLNLNASRLSLESFQAQGHARVGGVAIQKPVAKAIRPLPVVEGKGKAIVTGEQASQSWLALHNTKEEKPTGTILSKGGLQATEEASKTRDTILLHYHSMTHPPYCSWSSPSLAVLKNGVGSDKDIQ